MGRAVLILVWALAWSAPACAQSRTDRFDGWLTAVVAADWRSGNRPIQAFDNARRDVVKGLLAAGLPREGMVDYSLRPDVEAPTTARETIEGVTEAAARSPNGCLLYFTSHGSPEGIVFGPERTLTPLALAGLVRQWCGAKPTVVVMSACYSGVFMGALQGSNRMVLTAARRDRTSFGCGPDETYPWFDGCVIESLPQASDFLALAALTRACVARREIEAGVALPSEPQLFVGAEMQMRLPTLRFEKPEG